MFSDEGGFFGVLAGRYGGKVNIQAVLKAHSAGNLRVDRKGRDPEFVREAHLNLGFAVQPDVISGMAAQPDFRGFGLLARFFYGLPGTLCGVRDPDAPPLNDAVRADYERRVGALFEHCADLDGHAAQIELEPAAHSEIVEFKRWLEPQLADGAALSSIRDWANKLPGGICRISGVLHLAEVDLEAGEAVPQWIPRDTVLRAIRLGRYYLLPHALAAFASMGADPIVEKAKKVLAWLRRHPRQQVSQRDIHQGVRSHVPKAEELTKPLDLLVKHGYLRGPFPRPGGPKGGRPSLYYEVHPAIVSGQL